MGVRQPATAQLSSQYIKIIHFFYTLLIFISNYTIVCKSWADGICEVKHNEWCHRKLCDSCRRTFHKIWWETSNWEGVRILAGMGVNCCCVAVTLWIAKFSCIFLQLPDQANLDICIITIRKACMFSYFIVVFLTIFVHVSLGNFISYPAIKDHCGSWKCSYFCNICSVLRLNRPENCPDSWVHPRTDWELLPHWLGSDTIKQSQKVTIITIIHQGIISIYLTSFQLKLITNQKRLVIANKPYLIV